MRRDSVKLELFLLTLDSDVVEGLPTEMAAAVVVAAALPPNLELELGSSFSCLMEKPAGKYPPNSPGGGAMLCDGSVAAATVVALGFDDSSPELSLVMLSSLELCPSRFRP